MCSIDQYLNNKNLQNQINILMGTCFTKQKNSQQPTTKSSIRISNGMNSNPIKCIFQTSQLKLTSQEVNKLCSAKVDLNLTGPSAGVQGKYQSAQKFDNKDVTTIILLQPNQSKQVNYDNAKYLSVAEEQKGKLNMINQNTVLEPGLGFVYFKNRNHTMVQEDLIEKQRFKFAKSDGTGYLYPPGHCTVCQPRQFGVQEQVQTKIINGQEVEVHQAFILCEGHHS